MEQCNARALRGPIEVGFWYSKPCLCEGPAPAIPRLKWEVAESEAITRRSMGMPHHQHL